MTTQSPVLAAARVYLGRGWCPIPVHGRQKKPILDGWPTLTCDDATKNAASWFKDTRRNIGVSLGEPSGWLIDIDLDAPEAVALADEWLAETHAVFGRPGKVRSHRLYHVTAPIQTKRFSDPLRKGVGATLVEIRSTGGQTVFPPSTHESGEAISWDRGGEPLRIETEELRETVALLAVTALVRRYCGDTADDVLEQELEQWCTALDAIDRKLGDVAREWLANEPASVNLSARPEWMTDCDLGKADASLASLPEATPPPYSLHEAARLASALACLKGAARDYDAWWQYGLAIHRIGWGDNGFTIWDRWSQTAENYDAAACAQKWASFATAKVPANPKTIASIYHDAQRAGWTPPVLAATAIGPQPNNPNVIDIAKLARTDLGNARRLVARHGGDLRYVHPWARWFIWDGQRWVGDADGAIVRLAKSTVEAIHGQALALTEEGERMALLKHAVASQSEARLRAMVSLAESEPQVIATPQEFDADPWMLGVLNGVVDLRTSVFRPATKSDMITMRVGVAYDANARCPNWLAFLHVITAGDVELIAYLKRLSGYVLTGSAQEEILGVLYGSGRNGKSTWRETLHAVLGDYAIAADAGLLVERKQSGGATPEIMRLKGRRLVSINETAENDKLNEARVKFLTSGDTLTARSLYAGFVDFKPSHKTLLTTNHKPVIRGSDEGIWRRVHLIPFTVKIEGGRADYREKFLMPEAAGILNWMLEGCAAYLKEGLAPPKAVLAATAAYREEMDYVRRWLDEQCIVDPASAALASLAYQDFKMWCESEVGWSLNIQRWRRVLGEIGFEATKVRGQRLIKGFKLTKNFGPVLHAVQQ
jgi:P4 family phage/plasmid primase-like protien